MTAKPTLEAMPADTGLPSRRAMIGALAAIPVASVPALASAGAIDPPDPIFDLIESWKRADAKDVEANEIMIRLHDKVGSWSPVTVACSRRDWLKTAIIPPDEADAIVGGTKVWPETTITHQAWSRVDLERWFDSRRPYAGDEFEIERAAALAKFDEAKGAYDAMRESSGLIAAEERLEELTEARENAGDAVMRAQPRTHAGAAVLLVFAAEYWAESGSDDDRDIVVAMLNAARAIAGAEIPISKTLAAILAGDLECGEIPAA